MRDARSSAAGERVPRDRPVLRATRSIRRALFEQRELLRVRRHLQRVERELRAAPVAPEVARIRSAHLLELRRYWLAGRFPRNVARPGRIPVFQDDRGHVCAVGHLALASGRADLVEDVRAVDNHVRVADVHEGPLLEWLATTGLSQDEAARIQPTYEDWGYTPPAADAMPLSWLLDLIPAAICLAGVVLANVGLVMVHAMAARAWLPAAAIGRAKVALGLTALSAAAAAVGIAWLSVPPDGPLFVRWVAVAVGVVLIAATVTLLVDTGPRRDRAA